MIHLVLPTATTYSTHASPGLLHSLRVGELFLDSSLRVGELFIDSSLRAGELLIDSSLRRKYIVLEHDALMARVQLNRYSYSLV